MTLLFGALLTPFLPEAEATTAVRPSFTTTTKTAEAQQPIFAGAADEAAYMWTEDLFSAAGFEVPVAGIEFHRNMEACGGVRGRTYFSDEALATVVVCATHENPMVEEAWRQRTLLHELAHAWIDQNTAAEDIEAFTELRGLDEWSSRDVNWEQRATEHAAEIFMWGIQQGDYKVDFRIDDTSCEALLAGYELLTGVTISCEIASD